MHLVPCLAGAKVSDSPPEQLRSIMATPALGDSSSMRAHLAVNRSTSNFHLHVHSLASGRLPSLSRPCSLLKTFQSAAKVACIIYRRCGRGD